MADVASIMESAREVSKGVMELWVLFPTEADVEEAEAWMKGKHKVKLLVPMTPEESERRHAVAFKKVAKKTKVSKA